MELFSLYYTVITSVETFNAALGGSVGIPTIFYYGIIGVAVWAALFALCGVGIYTMAKRRSIDKPWRAFVPFVRLYLLGKIAGDCRFFGKKIKNIGLWVMIAQIVTTLVYIVGAVSEIYLYVTHGAPTGYTADQFPTWGALAGLSQTAYVAYSLSNSLITVFGLIYEILLYLLFTGLCQKYAPRNYMMLSLLVLFLPISQFIIVFVLRNREPINYEAYMRARYEAHMRQQQQYRNYQGQQPFGGNPYGNTPYGGNPYTSGNPQSSQNAQPAPEDPFEEFSQNSASGTHNTAGNTQNNNSSNGDDFFN